ncbi:MAG TPA: hypothetical protein VHC69_21290 [Polyangiaceae bacterium]|nr:hypothetical protein [Polyangiaceae bacterium]
MLIGAMRRRIPVRSSNKEILEMETNKKKWGRLLAAAGFVFSAVGLYVAKAIAQSCNALSTSWSGYACCTGSTGKSGCSTGDTVGLNTYVMVWDDAGQNCCSGLPWNWVGFGEDMGNNHLCQMLTAGSTASPACPSGVTHTEIFFEPPVC